MGRIATLGGLVDRLGHRIGPWLEGTLTSSASGSSVADSTLANRTSDDMFLGAQMVVTWATGSGRAYITDYSKSTGTFTLAPSLSVNPGAVQYQVLMPTDWQGYQDAINEAIQQAAPMVYRPRIYKHWVSLPDELEIEAPSWAADVMGLEIEAVFSGEGYRPVPVQWWDVESRHDLDGGPGEQWVVLRRPLRDGAQLRMHCAEYYAPLTAASPATDLDQEYILAQAEAVARRALANMAPAAQSDMQLQLMVDAQGKADERKQYLAQVLGSAREPAKEDKKK